MRWSVYSVRVILTASVSAAALLACAPEPLPPPPPAPVVWKVPPTRSAQVSQLNAEASKLQQKIGSLPGNTAADHRAAMGAVLQSLSRSISLAAGSKPSLSVVNQVSVIDQGRGVVLQSEASADRMGAAENQAILSAIGAIRELSMRPATPSPAVAAALTDAQEKLDSLQNTRGPLHELDATQTLASLGRSMQLLAEQFNGNGNGDETPAASPM